MGEVGVVKSVAQGWVNVEWSYNERQWVAPYALEDFERYVADGTWTKLLE
jgi:hypothetical protein